MRPRDEERKLTESQRESTTPRFKIEKLEERIAPAKGGIPGPPDHFNGGPNNCHPHRDGGSEFC